MIDRVKLYIKYLIGREIYIPKQVSCNTKVLGNDGCSFPVAIDLLPKGRTITVYSFGIGEDLSFSEALLDMFKAEVYAFDPTPKAQRFVYSSVLIHKDNFHFYTYGLSDIDGTEVFYLPENNDYVSGSVLARDGVDINNSITVEMKKLSTIMKELSHDEIDILKMDIEGSEFKALPQIIESGCKFNQLCVEFHHRFIPGSGADQLHNIIELLNNHGYFVAAVGTSGEEVLFIKKNQTV